YRKAKEVVEAAEADPEAFSDLKEKMDARHPLEGAGPHCNAVHGRSETKDKGSPLPAILPVVEKRTLFISHRKHKSIILQPLDGASPHCNAAAGMVTSSACPSSLPPVGLISCGVHVSRPRTY